MKKHHINYLKCKKNVKQRNKDSILGKPKIVIVGAGGAASILIENLSKNNSNDIKYLSFAENVDNFKLYDNEKVITMDIAKNIKITLEELEGYCTKYNKIEELNNLLSLMQKEDEIYRVIPTTAYCVPIINRASIKLKRDNKTIYKFDLFFANKFNINE